MFFLIHKKQHGETLDNFAGTEIDGVRNKKVTSTGDLVQETGLRGRYFLPTTRGVRKVA
jgi:hypothetical protein